jgi:O-antigen/teichoic acid export membrane protein
VLSTTAAIAGFTSVKMSTAERDLDFRTVTFIQVAGQLATIFTMVALAYMWRSVWALAIGNIVGSLTTVLLGYLVRKGHAHKFQLEADSTKSLVHFGKWIFLSTIVTFIGGEGLKAVQGGFITTAQFGVLAIAYSISAIPIELGVKITSSIGLPALSESYRNNPENLRNILRRFRVRVLTLSLLMVAAVSFTSNILVEFLYDERYHAAGAYVAAITLSNAIGLIYGGYQSALLTIGKSQTYLFVMTVAAILRIIGTIAGYEAFQVIGMIAGVGIANLVVLIVICLVMNNQKLLDLKIDAIAMASITLIALLVVLQFQI